MSRTITPWKRGRFLIAFGVMAVCGAATPEQDSPAIVYVAPIEGIIDLGLAPFVQRVLDDAATAQAAAVILEINTFGGRVDAAVAIRDALLDSPVRTVAFVNKRAISAGALIGLAAETLVMAEGSTIGAATPVQLGEPGSAPQAADEKSVSYVRKEFRATAESRQRPPLLAEAMVDADVEIPGVIAAGKLLTLTTEEALAQNLIDFRADSLENLLQQLGLGDAQVRHASPQWAENVVRVLTNPVVSSLLITIAMFGIILELRTPGFGVPGGVGIASLSLFLWGHWLVNLAGWEDLLLVVGGMALLALEFLVIPGFGIAGILGALVLLAGLVLSLTGDGDTAPVIVQAAGRVIFALLLAVLSSLLFLRLLPRLPFGRRLILETGLPASQGYESSPPGDHEWMGKRGRAMSPLRPAGIAEFDGTRVDVVSDGPLIESGAAVEVIRVDGNRIVVRQLARVD